MSTQTISIPLTDAESASLDTVRAAFQKQEQRFLRLVNFEVLQFDNGLQNVGEYAANVDEGDLPPVEVLEIPEDATEVATLRRELQNRTALYYGAVAVGPGTRNLLLARAGAPAAGGFISTAVANALAEWEFFERQEQDFDGSRIRRGKQEFEPDASARV